MCPIHTEQLNYRTKKKEHKRQRRREKEERRNERKHKRRKLSDHSDDDKQEAQEEDPEENEEPTTSKKVTEVSDTPVEAADEHIWSKQLDISKEQPSREQEFERYLEDLLM